MNNEFEISEAAIEAGVQNFLENYERRLDVNSFQKYLIICSGGRVGSTVLADILRQNGLGNPGEWYHLTYFQEISKRLIKQGFQFGDLQKLLNIHELIKRIFSSGDERIFCANIKLSQMYGYIRTHGHFPLSDFNRIYYLKRKNMFTMSYSYLKAQNSQVWHLSSKDQNKKPSVTPRAEDILMNIGATLHYINTLEPFFKDRIDAEFLYEEIVQNRFYDPVIQISKDLGIEIINPQIGTDFVKTSSSEDCFEIQNLLISLGGKLSDEGVIFKIENS